MLCEHGDTEDRFRESIENTHSHTLVVKGAERETHNEINTNLHKGGSEYP